MAILLKEEIRKNDAAASNVLNGIEQKLFEIDDAGKVSEEDKRMLKEYKDKLSVYTLPNANISNCCKDEVNVYLRMVDEILGNN